MITRASIVEQLRQLRLDAVASELASATTLTNERAALERALAFVEGYALGYQRGNWHWPAVRCECGEIESAIVQRLADLSPTRHLETVTHLNHEVEPNRNTSGEIL